MSSSLLDTLLLKALVTHTPLGILMIDATGRVLLANERYQTIFGPDVPATIHDPAWWSARPSDDRPDDATAPSALGRALAGALVTERARFTRADGVERWVSVTTAPLRDETQRIVGAVALYDDISHDVELLDARDRLLKQVEDERAKLKAFLTELPVAAIVFEAPDFRVEMVNDAYLALIGQRDVIGKTLAEIHPGVSADSILGYLTKVCAEKKPQERREHALVLPAPEGGKESRYFTNKFQPLFDDRGHVTRIITTVLDVTLEVRARALIADSADRLRLILDELPVGVNVRDAESEAVVLSNKSSFEILGVDVRDPAYASSWDAWRARHIDGRPMDPEDQAYRRTMRNREPVHNQLVMLTPRGRAEERVLRTSATCIASARQQHLVISIFEDVTEEHRLMVEQEQTARFAELFIGILAHDLRNPLQAIGMATSLLATSEGLPPGDLKRVRMIASSATRMADMVDELLDLTRGRLAGGIPIDPQPTDLVKVVGTVLDEIAISKQAVLLRRDLPVELVGRWDGNRLAQLVSNVVGNAVQHGDPTFPIEVWLRAEGPAVALRVHNRGAPIPTDFLPVLFDPFRHGTRAPNATSRGLGLGLYIAREIVLAHGGEVTVNSTAADGTTFTVTLPRFARGGVTGRTGT